MTKEDYMWSTVQEMKYSNVTVKKVVHDDMLDEDYIQFDYKVGSNIKQIRIHNNHIIDFVEKGMEAVKMNGGG